MSKTERERREVKSRIYGLLRGVVEYNLDPLGIGRCKVRIPSIHSSEISIETDLLPWAQAASVGGMHQTGSFIVPEVGATVWVQFEGGDPQYPVYFGGWLGNPISQREIHTKTSPVDLTEFPKIVVPTGGPSRQPIGPEAHPEVLGSPGFDPTAKVVYRSPKGATILVEERDGQESIRILDRTGQELSLHSPVTEEDNAGTVVVSGEIPTTWTGTMGLRRELRAASDGDEIPLENVVGETTRVRLLGTGGQGLYILASTKSNQVDLVSIDPEEGDEVRLRLGAGLGVLEIRGVSKGEENFRVSVNIRSGDVRVESAAQIRLATPTLAVEAEQIAIDGETRLNGNLTVSEDVIVGGKVIGG